MHSIESWILFDRSNEQAESDQPMVKKNIPREQQKFWVCSWSVFRWGLMVMLGLLLHLFVSGLVHVNVLSTIKMGSFMIWFSLIIFGSLLDQFVSGLVYVNVLSTIKFNAVWFMCKIISAASCPQAGTYTRGESRMLLGWVVSQWWALVTDKFPALTFLRSVPRENFSTLIYVLCPLSIVQCDKICWWKCFNQEILHIWSDLKFNLGNPTFVQLSEFWSFIY